MIPVFICDDIETDQQIIKKAVEDRISIKNLDMEVVVSATHPGPILDYIKTKAETGLYFLDVNLGSQFNGVKLAEEIRRYDPNAYIFFITAHREYMALTFKHKVGAIDYIVKDEENTNLAKRISDSIDHVLKLRMTLSANDLFRFKDPVGLMVTLEQSAIDYFNTSEKAHRVKVFTKLKQYEFYAKLYEVASKLNDGFYRCGRSLIVNTMNVSELNLTEKKIYFKDGTDFECLHIEILKLKRRLQSVS